jgi:hypothetical protein
MRDEAPRRLFDRGERLADLLQQFFAQLAIRERLNLIEAQGLDLVVKGIGGDVGLQHLIERRLGLGVGDQRFDRGVERQSAGGRARRR